MELLTTALIFGLVFAFVLTLLNARGTAAEREQSIIQRMTRPNEVVNVNILRGREQDQSIVAHTDDAPG